MGLAERKYDIDDIYSLPEGERAELIDGQLYMMAPPNTRHQRIIGRLYNKIQNHIDSKKGSCEALMAPFAVFLNEDDRTYVEPDISVVCDSLKIDDMGCHGAPDWIIEIVSPSSRRMDYMIKLFKYRSAGVREYWIVDPEKNRLLIYNFEQDTIEDHSLQDEVKSGIMEDLSIDLEEALAD